MNNRPTHTSRSKKSLAGKEKSFMVFGQRPSGNNQASLTDELTSELDSRKKNKGGILKKRG